MDSKILEIDHVENNSCGVGRDGGGGEPPAL